MTESTGCGGLKLSAAASKVFRIPELSEKVLDYISLSEFARLSEMNEDFGAAIEAYGRTSLSTEDLDFLRKSEVRNLRRAVASGQ